MKRRMLILTAAAAVLLAVLAWPLRPIGEYFGPESFVLFIDGVSYCHTNERGHRELTECLGSAYSGGTNRKTVWRTADDPDDVYRYMKGGGRDGNSLHIRSDQPHGRCWFCERSKPYPWEQDL